MYIVYGQADIQIIYSDSLKAKRKIVNSIISRIKNRFNVSICEADYHDLRQRTLLGFAAVTHTHSEIELILQSIEQIILSFDEITLLGFDAKENMITD